MRGGEFSAGLAKLQGAIENLQHAWQAARQEWEDETSARLDETQLQPMISDLKRIIEATAPLADVLGRARRDCSPTRESDR